MFLKAGAVSLALLLASRLLGLVRESAQAAAFGVTGMADVVVLMLTLPDWLAGVLASGALAYVLVPAWARPTADVAAIERRVGIALLAAGGVLALVLALAREPAARWLAPGVPTALASAAATAMVWSAVALPAAFLSALWTVRLQHERDFGGMYGANLVVNATLIASLAGVALLVPAERPVLWLGAGLVAAMLFRLGWLLARKRRYRRRDTGEPPLLTPAETHPGVDGHRVAPGLPRPSVWMWAALSAGLPLALPFVARSIASQSGSGALATFNYAWKLVELPLVLAIQLVATLAFPSIARAVAGGNDALTRRAIRGAFALAWTLACAAAAALVVAGPALATLLFGWGSMQADALARVADWATVGAWGLLPQSLIAVALTVLATRERMRVVVAAYVVALAGLLAAGSFGSSEGGHLMGLLNLLLAAVASVALLALGREARHWLPWRGMCVALAGLLALTAASLGNALPLPAPASLVQGLAAAAISATLVVTISWWGSRDLREALRG